MPTTAETTETVRDRKTGQLLRILPLIFFGIIAWFVLVGYYIMATVQFVVVIVTDEPNSQLRDFGSRVGTYMRELLDYLIYRTDQMPFPFAPFPGTVVKAKPAPSKKPAKTAKTTGK